MRRQSFVQIEKEEEEEEEEGEEREEEGEEEGMLCLTQDDHMAGRDDLCADQMLLLLQLYNPD